MSQCYEIYFIVVKCLTWFSPFSSCFIYRGRFYIKRIKGANLIWKFADKKVNGFGPAHIEKSHFKGIFGCIFRQSLMKYGGNKPSSYLSIPKNQWASAPLFLRNGELLGHSPIRNFYR
jgi:hypothetical protein